MILETKQVLFRVHMHLLDRRSRNAYDHLEQTVPWIPEAPRKTGPLVPQRQGLVPAPAAQPASDIVICETFLDN